MKILTNWLRAYVPNIPVDDHQLAEDLTLRGIAVEGIHDLGPANGHLYEMDITTNRVDAMNHYGIAREAATIYNLPLAPLAAKLPIGGLVDEPFPVRIDPSAKGLCGRFTAQVIRDVSITSSVGCIAEYFTLLGQKQISNAVDASNFTLLGMGHPTHAFDLDKIHGGLVVRLARKGEKLRLLDGSERTLEADDLVVADEAKALGLAGVMGGWDSMITPETKNILVEAAWFDPVSVRRSSRRHLLHTDASHRFERGADFNAAPIANALVTHLILTGGAAPDSSEPQLNGRLEGELIDLIDPEVAARTAHRPRIGLAVKDVRRQLGTTLEDQARVAVRAAQGLRILREGTPIDFGGLTPEQAERNRLQPAISSELIVQYLTALGCELVHGGHSWGGADFYYVNLPSWRLDLEREIDLIEEVARVYGYNRFANTLPTPGIVIAHPTEAKEAAIRTRLLSLGFSESVSSTFAGREDTDLFHTPHASKTPVPMENPLSEEASLLRPTLVPGMLNMLAHNLNRDVKEVRLFEQGQVFTGVAEVSSGAVEGSTAKAEASTDKRAAKAEAFIAEVHESPQLSLGITTAQPQASSLYPAVEAPIYELKGAIESILSLFTLQGGHTALTFTAEAPAWLAPGRSATALVNNQPIARFGELSASETQRRKLRQPVFLAQLDLAALYELPLRRVTAHDLSRFQAVERDFSFVFPDITQWHTIAAAIHALAIPELTSLKPVEIFRDPRGKAVSTGHYSLLLRAVFQSHDRTLREDELTQWHSTIISTLTTLGGTLRA